MDMYQGIMTTRAIRRFSGDEITDAEIEACLKAAMQAPSGGNTQPWQFLVVTEPETMIGMAEVYLEAYDRWEAALLANMPRFRSEGDRSSFMRGLEASRYLAEHLTEAEAFVLYLMPKVDLALEDEAGRIDIGPLYASVYPAVQNFLLAARSKGIGTVLTTVWWGRQADLRRMLGVPERFEIVALIPLGRPAGKFGVAPRKPFAAVTHWETFGNKRL